MKKLFFFLSLFLWAAHVSAQDEKVFVNDKNAEAREIKGFNSISVASGIDLFLSAGDKEMVVVSAAEPRYRDKIVTRLEGNTLKIYSEDKGKWLTWGNDERKLRVYVSYRNLNKLSASGSSDIFVNGFVQSDKLEIELSGSSDFKGAVKVGSLSLNQSGSSDSKITGRSEKLFIDLSGSSDVKAFSLESDYCDIHASGSSDVQITVNKELNVHSSGASDVYYMGNGVIRELRISGSSNVVRKNREEVKESKENI